MLQHSHGVRVGDVVPVFVDQTPNLLVAVTGILKAGAGYSPIPRDGSWPTQRIAQILESCRARVVVADTRRVPGADIPVVNLDDPLIRSERYVNMSGPGDIAYVLWTSGTTGDPKGVMMSHRGAVACISHMVKKLYPRTCDERVFQFSSPVFDVSVVDYFATLSIGATLCMMPRAEILDNIHAAISFLKPTAASLTPSVAQLLNPKTAGLRTLVVSGEVVAPRLRDMFIAEGTTLINAYGPTESNIA